MCLWTLVGALREEHSPTRMQGAETCHLKQLCALSADHDKNPEKRRDASSVVDEMSRDSVEAVERCSGWLNFDLERKRKKAWKCY